MNVTLATMKRFSAHDLLQLADREQAPLECQSGRATRWNMVQAGDGFTGQAKLLRNAISVDLYRGQNQHFDPCWPSLCRGFQRNLYRVADIDPIDRALLLRGLALNRWFVSEISKHPMMKWAKSEGLLVDSIALAQHYGIPTSYVDVSESFEVALFFATCRFMRATASWEPMAKGMGVMYRLHFNVVDEKISPICHQPFPRPFQQWAWTVELRLGESFLQIPALQVIGFDHDVKVGEEMLRRFDGGYKLLPYDPTVRLASAMCAASEIPITYVEEVESWFAKDLNGLSVQEAKQARIALQNDLRIGLSNVSAISYTPDELDVAEIEWLKCSHKFYSDVSFRVTK